MQLNVKQHACHSTSMYIQQIYRTCYSLIQNLTIADEALLHRIDANDPAHHMMHLVFFKKNRS